MQSTTDIKRPTLQQLDSITFYERQYERLSDKTNQMAGIIGSYKALLRCAIELSKGEVEIGTDYLESREAEMIKRINELYNH